MFNDFLSSLSSSAWSTFLVVFFFGGSIFVHELGHFLAARRRGLKVERFSIGFGPAIWSKRGADGVEYRLSWIPLGGYVALPQLADLSGIEGNSQVDAAELPKVSYSTKIFVFAAGAFFNVLFAFFLACILWAVGYPAVEEELTTRVGLVRKTMDLPDGSTVEGPAHAAGLQTGDLILSVDGHSVKTLNDIGQLVILGSGRTAEGNPSVVIEFERKAEHFSVTLHPVKVGAEEFRDIGIEPGTKVTVAALSRGMPAEAAGLLPHDVITKLNGQPVEYVSFISEYLRANGEKPVVVTYERDGQEHDLTITPAKATDPETKAVIYQIGVQLRPPFTLKTVRTQPFEQVWDKAVWTWRQLQSVISPTSDIGISKFSSPIGIAYRVNQFAQIDFRLVLWFVILVNVNLAIFNLLPIPVLDGGHMFFATVAKLRGRDLPFNVIATIQSVFMVLILTMIVYVGFFDVRRIRRDVKADAQAREAATEQQKKTVAPAKP